jgi:uncharacterized phage protein (TIGR01671 family)
MAFLDKNHQSGRFVFMQFTGLKDVRGKEIYEGDFLKLTGDFKRLGTVEVVWSQKYATFAMYTNGRGELPNDLLIFDDTDGQYMKREIVGNIYENELLKS